MRATEREVLLLSGTSVPGSRLLSVTAAQPDTIVTADELGRPFGRDGRWVTVRTGIERLRRGATRADMLSLANSAAADAITAAGLDDADIDMIITVSCSVGDAGATGRIVPYQRAPRAARMHLNSACSGFGYAVQTADALIRGGAVRHVLVVAVEHMSSLIDPTDLGTSIVFGDGAGAAVLGPDATPGIGPTVFGSEGATAGVLACDDAGLLRMAGREVFRWATSTVPRLAREACERAGVALSDIAAFVPHQANHRITDASARALGITGAAVADDVRISGNTSAASVPIALTRLRQAGRVAPGDLALLMGFGAGLSYAAQVLVLP